MAAPRGKAEPTPKPKAGAKSGAASSSRSAFLGTLASPRGILAIACVIAAVAVYLVAFGPFSSQRLPEVTRTPGYGAPLESVPHLVCGDGGVKTEAVSLSAATLEELALLGREKAPRSAAVKASLYQITLDQADLAAATTSIISWRSAEGPDPVIQLSATKANGTGWQLASISTCG